MFSIINPSFLNGEIISLKELSFHILDYMNVNDLKQAKLTKLFYDRSDLRQIFNYNKKEPVPFLYNQKQQDMLEDFHEIKYVICAEQIQKCYHFIKGLIIQREDIAVFKIPQDELFSKDSMAEYRLKDFDKINFCEKTLWDYFVYKGNTDNFSLYFSFNAVNYVDPKNSLCLSLGHKNKVLIASQKLIAFLKSKYGDNFQLMKKEIKNEVERMFSREAGFSFLKEEKAAIIINASTPNQDDNTIEEDEISEDKS